jgi:hypothetical protein
MSLQNTVLGIKVPIYQYLPDASVNDVLDSISSRIVAQLVDIFRFVYCLINDQDLCTASRKS